MTLSNLTVTTAATSRMLVQRSDVKTELSISGSGDDAKIDRLILGASLAIAGELGREPWIQTYQEKLPGQGGHYLLLSRRPIQSKPTVTEGLGSNPNTVTASTYSVAGNADRDRLYREDGWTLDTLGSPESFAASTGPQLSYTVTYTAGWVMPDQVTEWASSTAVSANEWYKATDFDEPFIFQADSSGGTTDSTEPTWPTAIEGTVTDNDFTWTAWDQALPKALEEAAMITVIDWFRGGLQVPTGVISERFESMEIRYGSTGGSPTLPRHASALVSLYR